MVQKDFSEVDFIKEKMFGEQLRELVDRASEHVLLCCDDSLYFRTLELESVAYRVPVEQLSAGSFRRIVEVLSNPQVVSYHVMLHPGLRFCHPQVRPNHLDTHELCAARANHPHHQPRLCLLGATASHGFGSWFRLAGCLLLGDMGCDVGKTRMELSMGPIVHCLSTVTHQLTHGFLP